VTEARASRVSEPAKLCQGLWGRADPVPQTDEYSLDVVAYTLEVLADTFEAAAIVRAPGA